MDQITIFPWFSHGFPMVFPMVHICPDAHLSRYRLHTGQRHLLGPVDAKMLAPQWENIPSGCLT